MLISVLMTVYNQTLPTIFRAINSVCNQDFSQNYELIIVDDGSRFQIEKAIKDFIKNIDLPITYIKQVNQGQANALNKAFSISKGSYISIIDADDQFLDMHLAQNLFQISNFKLIYSEAVIIADNEIDFFVPDKDVLSKLVHIKDCVVMGTIFGKREVFQNIKFEEHRALDAIFFEKAEKDYPSLVKKIPAKTYVYYRNSASSKTNKIKAAILSHNLSPNDLDELIKKNQLRVS